MLRGALRDGLLWRDVDPEDSRWWRRSRWLLEVQEGELERQDEAAGFAYDTALLTSGDFEGDDLESIRQRALSSLQRQSELLFPWQPKGADGEKKFGQSLEEMYRRTVGDLNDPAFVAQLREVAARDNADIDAKINAEENSPLKLLERRLKDRDQKPA